MKPTLTGKRHALPLALLSAVIAVPVVIAGCSGGNGGLLNPSTTAGSTTAGSTTAGTTTSGSTTAGGTTAGTTTAGTTAGNTTAGGTTGPVNTAYTVTGNLPFSNIVPPTRIPTNSAFTLFDTSNPGGTSAFRSLGIIDRSQSNAEVVSFSANSNLRRDATDKRIVSVFLVSSRATVPAATFKVGQIFPLAFDDDKGSLFISNEEEFSGTLTSGAIISYKASAGTIEVTDVGRTSISLRIRNARFTLFTANFDDKSAFTIDGGTLNAINLTEGAINSRIAR